MIKGMDRWLSGYLASRRRRPGPARRPRHLMFCVADHFEPFSRSIGPEAALDRVTRWSTNTRRCSPGSKMPTGGGPNTLSFTRQKSTARNGSASCVNSSQKDTVKWKSTFTTVATRRKAWEKRCWSSRRTCGPITACSEKTIRETYVTGLCTELGPVQLSSERRLVRRERRADGPAENGLLRGFHLPVGAVAEPAAHGQRHLPGEGYAGPAPRA